MGHYIHTDIVPYVKRNVINLSRGPYDGPEELCKLVIPQCYMALECDFQEDDDQPEPKIRGWDITPDVHLSITKKKETIIGHLFVKGDTKVYLVNESQYSNVDCHEIAVVAEDPKHITEFCNDFKDLLSTGSKIEGPDEVIHWWF